MTSDASRLRFADYLSHMLEGAQLARAYVGGISNRILVAWVASARP